MNFGPGPEAMLSARGPQRALTQRLATFPE
jgi:hypothetical protein